VIECHLDRSILLSVPLVSTRTTGGNIRQTPVASAWLLGSFFSCQSSFCSCNLIVDSILNLLLRRTFERSSPEAVCRFQLRCARYSFSVAVNPAPDRAGCLQIGLAVSGELSKSLLRHTIPYQLVHRSGESNVLPQWYIRTHINIRLRKENET
jgi:hypothetical protein